MTDKLIFDDKNANKGTERGGEKLTDSLSELGIGRGITVFTIFDKNGKIIAVDKTVEKIKAPVQVVDNA